MGRAKLRSAASLVICLLAGGEIVAADWRPADGPLMTRWAKDVSPDNALPEYPRPQMVRDRWVNLNGLWEYAIQPQDADAAPDKWDGKILVPFAIESALSGVRKVVGPENRLWYKTTFRAPEIAKDGRLLLHFGAVDWHAVVWVNGIKVGEHKGGYDPFTFDITDAIGTRKSPTEDLVVAVWDPSDAGVQPRGKQVRRPGGIFYTSVTGIWQTVWLEPVPPARIESVHISTDVDRDQATIDVENFNRSNSQMELELVLIDDKERRPLAGASSKKTTRDGSSDYEKVMTSTMTSGFSKHWSPDSPFLYEVEITLKMDDEVVDRVSTYFGMRKIEVKKDEDGFNRLLLNNKPLFQHGPLDQGWWPDGLYTAPTDAALQWDIEMTKKLGFNMCRKHVKVEPARWYYWCDKLGLLVWQDMPNGDRHIGGADPDIERSPESEEIYRREWQAIIQARRGHPSIVAWVPFNEGWGQFKTNEILDWTKEFDPTRLVDGPSGWTDRGGGDMHDMHAYPGPSMFAPEDKRASVLGEFGGLGLPLEGHLWQQKDNWGYRSYKTTEELLTNYELLIRKLRPLIGKGLAAAVYTQTTDVEGEVNGLITYDRQVVKFDAERLAALHRKLYEPPPIIDVTTIVPTSEREGQTWKFTTARPGDDWAKPDFDDAKWQDAPGGFGEKTTPGTHVRTEWKTPDIWLRKSFDLSSLPKGDVQLRLHHDEDAEIYLNGVLAAKTEGYTVDYFELPLSAEAKAALKAGKNTLAVRCHQTSGGQYIDVGLVDVVESPREAVNTDR